MSCLCRWAQFRQCIDDIEANVKSLRDGDPVSYKQSIGGIYYVSVTSGFYCIDIRKFYLPYGETTDVRPTRQGLALRLREWSEMRKIIDSINSAYPAIGNCSAVLPRRRSSEPDRGATLSGVHCRLVLKHSSFLHVSNTTR